MLKILVAENTFGKGGKPFSFRSRTSEILSYPEIVSIIEAYHSTLTKTDIQSVLEQFAEILFSKVAQGYLVKTPLGSFKVRASGGADSIEEAFEPENEEKNHSIKMGVLLSKEQKATLMASLKYERISSKYVSDPFVADVLALDTAGVQSKRTSFAGGDFIRLRGECLKLDSTDAKQGVYLVSAETGSQTRITDYIRCGSSIIDAVVPAAMGTGDYYVRVCTKPGVSRYEDYTFKEAVTIA